MSTHPTPPPPVGSWPARRARARPAATALVHHGRRTTYAELDARVTALAAGLGRAGVGHGDRVAHLGANDPAFVETLFAVLALGAVFVPLNTRLAAAELAALVDDAGADLLVHAPSHDAVADALAAGRPTLRTVGTGDGLAALRAGAGTPPARPPVQPDDLAVILYTSGTTGRAKGARMTHGNLTWNALSVLVDVDLAASEVCLLSAPLFHAAALGMTCLPVLLKGGTLVLEESFDPDATLDLVEAEGVTMMFGVPTMFDAVSRAARFDDADLSTVRYLLCGGAPVPRPLIERYGARGLTFLQGYGMTEASPGVLLLAAEDAADHVGSAGRPAFFVDVALHDPAGPDAVPGPPPGPGSPGEVLVRGPNVVDGYWGDPGGGSSPFTAEGWFRSGDLAVVDDEGRYTIVDRLKDVFISGGENVHPAEVEAVLVTFPGVLDAAVVGVPDERWGEVGRAFVVAEGVGGAPDPEAVRAFVAGRLARFKVPRDVRVVAALPRNATGKVDKPALRHPSPEAPPTG